VILVKKYIKKDDEIKMAYDEIYRVRALAYKKNGDTFKELYEAFKITARTYYQWVELEQSTGGLAYSTSPGRPREISREALRHAVEAQPDLYLREYAAALGCSISAVDQTFKEERMTLKKTFTYSESSEEKREHFRADSAGIPAEAWVYLDESGIRTYLSREYGRAARGAPVAGSRRGRRHQSMNVVAGEIVTEAGVSVVAPVCYTGATTALLFETWFELFLLPELEVGSVIVMDNASVHRKKALTEIAKNRGFSLLFCRRILPILTL
jgi:transposase